MRLEPLQTAWAPARKRSNTLFHDNDGNAIDERGPTDGAVQNVIDVATSGMT
jgi:hypothetical protein